MDHEKRALALSGPKTAYSASDRSRRRPQRSFRDQAHAPPPSDEEAKHAPGRPCGTEVVHVIATYLASFRQRVSRTPPPIPSSSDLTGITIIRELSQGSRKPWGIEAKKSTIGPLLRKLLRGQSGWPSVD